MVFESPVLVICKGISPLLKKYQDSFVNKNEYARFLDVELPHSYRE